MAVAQVTCDFVQSQSLELLAHGALDDDLLQGLIDLALRELDATGQRAEHGVGSMEVVGNIEGRCIVRCVDVASSWSGPVVPSLPGSYLERYVQYVAARQVRLVRSVYRLITSSIPTLVQ